MQYVMLGMKLFTASVCFRLLRRSLNPNKHLREQFVSNLPGSSMLEVAALLNNVAIKVLMPLKLIISVASRITQEGTTGSCKVLFWLLTTKMSSNSLIKWN
ncbi:hypothetical protein E1A91_A03G172300v1 [Gossypium mustelinum]|uniref:Uncharacterized protein n=1 Tax=Gossypium mustelinum TaxID=34275 RepID=A0A5D3A1D8_GOSMU|nr:hypothetical protein E1A91_A03G172300v1 [Gossypium mustelinum]